METLKKLFKLVRGQRVLQALEEEVSYTDLEQNTKRFVPPSEKRQHATGPVQISKMQFVPYTGSNTLLVKADVNSNGHHYTSMMMFEGDVEFHEQDQPNNVTFRAADNQQYSITPISLQDHNVKVRCDCLDFRWRFSIWNAEKEGLYGDPPGLYMKKTDRPSVNPRRVPGLCKHLLKMAQELRRTKIVS